MKGIVTRTVGGFFFPADKEQNIYRTGIRGRINKRIYPGDYVEFKNGIIEKLYPRNNLLIRPQVANIDQILIILSTDNPPYHLRNLDRFLIVSEKAGLNPLIIINKIDLVENLEILQKDFQVYEKAGYRVYYISVKGRNGLEKLCKELQGHINVLTGPSGAGKSSLLNSIIRGAKLQVGEISKKLKRGVHTTKHVQLLPLDNEGWVADTPGFNSLDISHISPNELSFFYPEFWDYHNKCKFRACSHTHEPGCAVKKAFKKGIISERRYNNYCNFYNELQGE
ncbi:MAG TPA: ribosome small subunit-dependent GTPase A [Halanaerobiales bacterium]|nr:ribosome small subunit-dependent GTPase A [Halanaerobiales bacterium]